MRTKKDYVAVVKEKQPISITGLVPHCAGWLKHWLFCGKYRDTFDNPAFDDRTTEPVVVYVIHGTADVPTSCKKISGRLNANLPADVSKVYIPSFSRVPTNDSIEAYAEELEHIITTNGHKGDFNWSFARWFDCITFL